MLNFQTKAEAERLQSGASRPPLGRPAWDSLRSAPTFSWTLLISSWGWCRLHWFNTESCRITGLGSARLGLPFHQHLDPRVHEVHTSVPSQKISVSVAGGLLNPCARLTRISSLVLAVERLNNLHWNISCLLFRFLSRSFASFSKVV